MTWHTVADIANDLRVWDDEYVVYNSCSGNTHLLGLAAGQILTLLDTHPLDVDTLASRLAVEWQQDCDADFTQEVQNLLANLQELSLVECV